MVTRRVGPERPRRRRGSSSSSFDMDSNQIYTVSPVHHAGQCAAHWLGSDIALENTGHAALHGMLHLFCQYSTSKVTSSASYHHLDVVMNGHDNPAPLPLQIARIRHKSSPN